MDELEEKLHQGVRISIDLGVVSYWLDAEEGYYQVSTEGQDGTIFTDFCDALADLVQRAGAVYER